MLAKTPYFHDMIGKLRERETYVLHRVIVQLYVLVTIIILIRDN